MCNEFAQERAWREYSEMMQREALKIITPEPPDLPLGSIRPSERVRIAWTSAYACAGSSVSARSR